tara:strand:- start:717 stop:1043 length:327 start_codon:yes stop_codon:yes gene_type:complete
MWHSLPFLQAEPMHYYSRPSKAARIRGRKKFNRDENNYRGPKVDLYKKYRIYSDSIDEYCEFNVRLSSLKSNEPVLECSGFVVVAFFKNRKAYWNSWNKAKDWRPIRS